MGLEMWTCPRCGRSFANSNQSHACQTTTIAEYLEGRPVEVVAIYEDVLAALDAAGVYRCHAMRNGIGFISRMTFAGVSLSRRWLDLRFILPEPVDDPRVRRLEVYGPHSWVHRVRLHRREDVDESVRGWLDRALHRGNQEVPETSPGLPPLTDSQLAVFWAGLATRVETLGTEAVVALPAHVGSALASAERIGVRARGVDIESPLLRVGGETYVRLPSSLDPEVGERIDVYLHALTVAE
jgi:hypothetical protein